ncbi:MAG: hypothetical protein FWG87_04510 [Defluviitaleaceae bacterium]|nr:hypothetical protein [Defluviitaleaceae bacterium]
MKRAWILVLILAVATACGGNSEPVATPAPTQQETPAATNDTPAETAETTDTPTEVAPAVEADTTTGAALAEAEPTEAADPEENPWGTEVEFSGTAVKMTYGQDWDSFQLLHDFEDDMYTVAFSVLHPAQAGEDNFTIQPLGELWSGQWNFVGDDMENIGTYNIHPDVWNKIEFTFAGTQARTGIRFAGDYPRVVGEGFYITDLVITNSAGDVVLATDFADGMGTASNNRDANGSTEVVEI